MAGSTRGRNCRPGRARRRGRRSTRRLWLRGDRRGVQNVRCGAGAAVVEGKEIVAEHVPGDGPLAGDDGVADQEGDDEDGDEPTAAPEARGEGMVGSENILNGSREMHLGISGIGVIGEGGLPIANCQLPILKFPLSDGQATHRFRAKRIMRTAERGPEIRV